MKQRVWLILLVAAVFEAGGDAIMRIGLRGRGPWFIFLGCLVLGSYGAMINIVRWDFSKLLGVYVGVFALVSVLIGRFLLGEEIPMSTWIGLLVIICGGLIIQFGSEI